MKQLSLLITIVFFCACAKETSTPVYNFNPVLTAYLNSDQSFSLQLTHQQSTSSSVYTAPGLDSLDIVIRVNDTDHHLVPRGNGIYEDSSLMVRSGNKCDLAFVYNGKTVTASTIIPSKPVSFSESATEISVEQITSTSSAPGFPGSGETVTLDWTNNDGTYYLVVIQNLESNPERIVDTAASSIDTSRIFRNRPSISNSYDLTGRSFTYFGKHRIILFHINSDYAFLYDNSGNSSENLSTPSTGITNGVGIFTGINSDTLFLQVDKK